MKTDNAKFRSAKHIHKKDHPNYTQHPYIKQQKDVYQILNEMSDAEFYERMESVFGTPYNDLHNESKMRTNTQVMISFGQEETALLKRLDEERKKECKTRSGWVKDQIREKYLPKRELVLTT